MPAYRHRRLPVGAEVTPEGAHFRVWAPRCQRVQVVLDDEPRRHTARSVDLGAEPRGYFSAVVPSAGDGTLYRYRLDESRDLYPDPASRYQPDGPHGPSRVVDPACFGWSDGAWRGNALPGQVVYELHTGTFTPEGTWAAAGRKLSDIAALGVTAVEVMPVAEFAGRFGWGYDGVDLFAPTHLYGEPDDFRRFVAHAHALGLGVILDVVYNHIGPDGNYLERFSRDYFTDRYTTDWGTAINFDGENSEPVREFFVANAGYWIDEFHLDGLRLDATQNIYDASGEHVLAAITRRAHAAAGSRSVIIVAENEPQDIKLVRAVEQGGYGMDGVWNDDFHHTAHVALTGQNGAYYSDYGGTPQELISAIKRGYLYQGQRYKWQKKRRGTPTVWVKPGAFVSFLQNHDQISNSARGQRIHQLTSPGRYKAMTALVLLGPGTPMLFQGQEFATSSPFPFFADHNPELAALVRKGRLEFLKQFENLADPEIEFCLPDPCDPATFERAKINWDERTQHAAIYALHADLLKLRREDPVFSAQASGGLDGAVLGASVFVLRFFGDSGDDRLLIVDLGSEARFESFPEPLLAPPENMRWEILWSSEHPRYGGSGTAPVETDEGWHIPGEAAVVLFPQPLESAGNG